MGFLQQFFKDNQLLIAALIVAGAVVFYKNQSVLPGPGPAPFDSVKAGRAYGQLLCSSYATASKEAATVLRAGQTVKMAQDTLKESWQKASTDGYVSLFNSAMVAIVPEGQDTLTPEQRERLAQFIEQVGAGVGSVK